jgi:TctA family transporter
MTQIVVSTNPYERGSADMGTNEESAKHVVDALSIGTVVGTLAGVLPSIAAIFTIVWTSIRIYETDTVQKLLRKKRKKRDPD